MLSNEDECIVLCTEDPACDAVAFDTTSNICYTRADADIGMLPATIPNYVSTWKVTTFDHSYTWTNLQRVSFLNHSHTELFMSTLYPRICISTVLPPALTFGT